jgi:hypothetical protein
MSRLTVADSMVLDNILDDFPEYKWEECVGYLANQYGIEGYEEDKFEHLDKFGEKEIRDYYGDDLLSEYEPKELMSWCGLEDVREKWSLAEQLEYYVEHWNKDDLLQFVVDMYKKK